MRSLLCFAACALFVLGCQDGTVTVTGEKAHLYRDLEPCLYHWHEPSGSNIYAVVQKGTRIPAYGDYYGKESMCVKIKHDGTTGYVSIADPIRWKQYGDSR